MSWFVDKLGPLPTGGANPPRAQQQPAQQSGRPQQQQQQQRAPAPQPQRAAAPPPPPPEPEKKKKKGWF